MHFLAVSALGLANAYLPGRSRVTARPIPARRQISFREFMFAISQAGRSIGQFEDYVLMWNRTFPVKWVYFEVISELSQPMGPTR